MSVNLLDGTVNPYRTSEITRIQDFYGIRYEELFDEDAMLKKGIKTEELDYIIENRDIEYAKKSTVGFELRKGVFGSDKFKKLQEFYGFSMKATQDVEELKKLGVSKEDIFYITGKKLDKKVAIEPKTISDDAVKKVAEAKENLGGVPDMAKGSKGTEEKPVEVDVKIVIEGDVVKEDNFEELRKLHQGKFGRYPAKNIKMSTLKKKLGIKN